MNQCIEVLKNIVHDWNDFQGTESSVQRIAQSDNFDLFEIRMNANIEEAKRIIEESEVV